MNKHLKYCLVGLLFFAIITAYVLLLIQYPFIPGVLLACFLVYVIGKLLCNFFDNHGAN